MLLQVVSFAGNVNGDFTAGRKSNASDLSQRRVRLLWRHRADDEADTLLERVFLKHRRLAERSLLPARLTNELVDRGHAWRIDSDCEIWESVSVSEAGVVSRQAACLPQSLLSAQERFQRGGARLGRLTFLAAVAAIGLLQQRE